MKGVAGSSTSMVRGFFAERGVDERQLNLLLNLGFIMMVTVAVLTRVVTVDMDAWRGWTPGEIFFRIPLDNWDSYMSELLEHPILVKAVTSGSVYAIGDWVAQVRRSPTEKKHPDIPLSVTHSSS